jgi:hypothetical protein
MAPYLPRMEQARTNLKTEKIGKMVSAAKTEFPSLLLLIVTFVSTSCFGHAAAAAGPQKSAATARVEDLYNGFPVGTDTEGHDGYGAAQKA